MEKHDDPERPVKFGKRANDRAETFGPYLLPSAAATSKTNGG